MARATGGRAAPAGRPRRSAAGSEPTGEAGEPPARSEPTSADAAPRHGSRRYFFEFLSVTLGVLLALVLEQAATSWRASQRVDDIRAVMNKEISDYAEIFNLRLRTDSCISAKLDALESHVASGGSAAVTNVGRPSYLFSSRGAFSSDATDQLTRYLGADTVQKYGEIYQGMADYAEFSSDEQKMWIVLQTLEGDKDPIGADRRAHLREAIVGARNDRLLLQAIASQMVEKAGNLGIKRNRSLDGMKAAETPLCRPLAPSASPQP